MTTFARPEIDVPESSSAVHKMNAKKLVAVLATAGILVSLAQTLIIPIIGALPEIFSTTASNTSWIVTITLLTGAITTPVVGRLGDMYGKKQMMLIVLIPFFLGSIICALSGDVVMMVVGRGLQGMGSGMIPLGISMLHDLLPKEKAGAAIGLMSSSMGIGGAVGIPLSAGIAQFATWRVLFWVTAVFAVVLVVAIWKIVPANKPARDSHTFDYVGAFGLALGLVAMLLAISNGSAWGWLSPLTLGFLSGSGLVFVLWGYHQLDRRGPLIDLRVTAKPVVLLTNLASILIGFSLYAMNLILPQVMQLPVELGYGLGQNMLQMGLWMAPMGIGMMAVAGFGAWISHVRGPRITLTIAGVSIAFGYGLIALIMLTLGDRPTGAAESSLIILTLILLLVGTIVVGGGIGLAFGAMPALIMGSVPASEKGAANGFNALMRSIGTASGAAVIGAVLASLVTQTGGQSIPTQSAFIIALLIAGGGAVIAAILAIVIPRNKATMGERYADA